MQPTRWPSFRACSVLTVACAVFLCAVQSAHAASLPAPSTFVQCFADGNNAFHATDCEKGGVPGVPPTARASAALSPFPEAFAYVEAPRATALGAGADATAAYYFQVTGGNVGDLVPILFDFRLEASSTAESSALARLIIRTSVTPFHVEELLCNPQGCDETSLYDTVSLQVQSGAMLDSVTLQAQVQAPATHFSDESARAYVDPYIYIDPTFPNASLYSIVVSQGVGNVPVPEPAAPLLAALALAGLGLAKSRAGWR